MSADNDEDDVATGYEDVRLKFSDTGFLNHFKNLKRFKSNRDAHFK